MSSSGALPLPQHDQREACETLLHMARRRTGRIPPELLAGHVIDLYAEADWPVKRAAMEALLRRFDFARRDALRLAGRPARGRALGLYRTRARAGSARPYRTVLRSLTPLRGSCDCPDFLRSSLGVCKHLLVALDALAARPRVLEQALRKTPAPNGRAARLAWDPIRPLHGRGDWLERVRLETARTGRRREPGSLARAREHFVPEGGGSGRLKSAWPEHPERRLTLVSDLLALLDATARSVEVEPALRALLVEEQQRLETLAQARRGRRPSLHGLRRKLYPYQRQGVARLLGAERLLLADDMGLGKTIQAAAACHALHRAGRVRRGLVIAPASLKGQWEREWHETTSVPVAVVEGPPAERAHAYRRTSSGFLIANYEQVLRDLDVILAWDPEIIVLDEAQRIKNWATKTAAFVKRLRPRYRLVLTGTPMENRLEELASIMDWVDDHALEPKWRLAPWHSVFADGRRETVGARHLDTLRERVAPHMLRRVRSEVLSQLPPRTDTVMPVEMTDAQREEHDALDRPIASILRRARKRPLTQAEFLRLMTLLTTKRIIANGLAQHRFDGIWPGIERARPHEALLASLSSPKLAEVRALLAAIAVEQERKVVVFSQWRRMLRLAHWAVADVLADAGLRAAFFTGQERPRQRTRNLVDFHDDPAARVLFATDAGGVGLNLQRAASACVVLDLPWNPAVFEQRVGRIYRIGQKRPIDVYSLVSQGSIEERIASLVADKRALFRGLFDGTSDSVRFDRSGSFLANLEKLVGEDTPARAAGEREGAEEAEEETAEALEAWLDEGDGDAEGGEGGNGEEERGAVRGAEGPSGSAAEADRGPRQGAQVVAASDVAALFTKLAVERTDAGGLRIEAPPDAAEALAALFAGFADALRRSTR
jgi:superfamily II DNA or RNA helicase